MLTTETERRARKTLQKPPLCYHCGLPCLTSNICMEDKFFCCEGCKLVFEIIESSGLCNYYELQNHPGLTAIKAIRNDKYAFLDEASIAERLYRFTNGTYTIVTLYLPGVHCSSCMWLLEHLHRLNESISESRLNFSGKEVTIHFDRSKISLRQVVELLATIGYEPYISLEDNEHAKATSANKMRTYRLGVAGFCFSFIMMMSFPEYFGGAGFSERYAGILRALNLLLSLPVVFFCAAEFFSTAWKGLKAKMLNIDAPIALAILITFSRSLYEIISGTGAGYLDSMSGIVFFMLIGRVVQERTYRSISFHRDYKSYFPVAVRVVAESGMTTKSLHDLQDGDVVELYNDEIIPADGILLKGTARIDYSFVTGESEPVNVAEGHNVYAGGRQTGESIRVQLRQPVSGSYLTSLWNHQAFSKNKVQDGRDDSSIHTLSRYFTITLFSLALMTGIYWAVFDASKVLNAVTAMLIVACPCALLLSSTFTNGNLLRLFSNAGLFLRDASVIEQLGKINTIVFDKTGTLTQGTEVKFCDAIEMTDEGKRLLHLAVASSKHPYSQALAAYSADHSSGTIEYWKETAGQGVEAIIEGIPVTVGSSAFTGCNSPKGNVHACIGKEYYSFTLQPQFRNGLTPLFKKLRSRFHITLLSGDKSVMWNLERNFLNSGVPGSTSRFYLQIKA